MNELLRTLLFLPPQSSTVARPIDGLHYFVILTTMAGAGAVTLVGGSFLIRNRRRTLPREQRAPKLLPWRAEVLVICGLFSLFMIWWWIGFRQFVELRVAPAGALTIYVSAKQWMWQFAYPNGGRSLTALYVPAGRPIQLVLTSRDVIHSYFVPDFRIKQDAVPGRYTTVWFEAPNPGRHQILCTQFCGAGHSTMRGEVVVLSPADYGRWLQGTPQHSPLAGPTDIEPTTVDQLLPTESINLVTLGERIAAQVGCFRCHSSDGTAHIGPTWAGLYRAKIPLQPHGDIVADEAYLTESMMEPGVKVRRGYPDLMPSFQGRLRPPEVAALVEYIKSVREVRPEETP